MVIRIMEATKMQKANKGQSFDRKDAQQDEHSKRRTNILCKLNVHRLYGYFLQGVYKKKIYSHLQFYTRSSTTYASVNLRPNW